MKRAYVVIEAKSVLEADGETRGDASSSRRTILIRLWNFPLPD
jgi:hypothetical protein